MLECFCVNKQTGELLPSAAAIREYYAQPGRGCLDSWLDEWQPVESMLVPDSDIGDPVAAFAAAVKI